MKLNIRNRTKSNSMNKEINKNKANNKSSKMIFQGYNNNNSSKMIFYNENIRINAQKKNKNKKYAKRKKII